MSSPSFEQHVLVSRQTRPLLARSFSRFSDSLYKCFVSFSRLSCLMKAAMPQENKSDGNLKKECLNCKYCIICNCTCSSTEDPLSFSLGTSLCVAIRLLVCFCMWQNPFWNQLPVFIVAPPLIMNMCCSSTVLSALTKFFCVSCFDSAKV